MCLIPTAECSSIYFTMSERLKGMIDRKVLELGKSGEAKLAIQAEVSPKTVNTARTTGHVSRTVGYRLALACGATKEEAEVLADEASSQARETA
jgi:hypothetical protein